MAAHLTEGLNVPNMPSGQAASPQGCLHLRPLHMQQGQDAVVGHRLLQD
jgi:hypothetical protein